MSHIDAWKQFEDSVEVCNRMAKQFGTDSSQFSTARSEMISSLGKAAGVYLALNNAGMIRPGSEEEKQYTFLKEKLALIFGK